MKVLIVSLALIGMCGVGGCRSNADPNEPGSTPNIQDQISQPTPDIEQPTFDFGLWVSEKEFLATDETVDVYFYAEVVDESSSVNLLDSNNNVVAEMKDDGQYNTSGDDIQGDGVFTAKVNISLESAGIFTYRAVTQIGGEDVVSNEVTIKIIAPFTEQELADMDTVRETLGAMRISTEYLEMTVEQRAETVLRILGELAEQGLVKSDSIQYDEGGKMVTYRHISGVIASEMLVEFSRGNRGIGG